MGRHLFRVQMPNPLKKGSYNITAKFGRLRVGDIDFVPNAVQFSVEEISFDPTNVSYAFARGGLVPAILKWQKIET